MMTRSMTKKNNAVQAKNEDTQVKENNNAIPVKNEDMQVKAVQPPEKVKYLDIAVIKHCSPDYQNHKDLEYITREEYNRRGYAGIKEGEPVHWNNSSCGGYKDGYKLALSVKSLDCGSYELKKRNLEEWEAIHEVTEKDIWIVAPKGWHWEYCSEKAYFTFSWYELKPIKN